MSTETIPFPGAKSPGIANVTRHAWITSEDVEAAEAPETPRGGPFEPHDDHNGDFVTTTENRDLKRGLEQRHLSMLGIAGAIGTGLFLGLGGAIQTGGPLGALLGYATIGLIVCSVQFALGEVSALLPVTGSFVRHAEFLVDPAWGFAIGWNLHIATGDWGKFLGYWGVMTSAVFSFAGVESLAMAAAETQNPRRAIPRACKRVFARIVLFYMLAVLVVGMLVASNDPRLDDASGTAAQSPFVIAASAAGIPAIPSVVNAVVITSAWSASNQSLLAGTRVLFGLALKGQAPKIFLRTTAWGTPYVCVLLFTVFMLLSFMSLSNGALTVFWWLVDLTAAGVLVSWSAILLNHIRLKKAMKKQGIAFSRLPWNNSWTFYTSHVALFMCILILFTSGFEVFTKGNWSASGFVSSYLDIPLVTLAFLTWKFVKKTKAVSLENIPLHDAFEQADSYPEEPEVKKTGPIRFVSWIWE
ncbi:dicarboxylic amino acid permease [Colletotrichum tofieldiae]|nr:dicarboxylic amino acid permease [Colletotrichum tofieldiae]